MLAASAARIGARATEYGPRMNPERPFRAEKRRIELQAGHGRPSYPTTEICVAPPGTPAIPTIGGSHAHRKTLRRGCEETFVHTTRRSPGSRRKVQSRRARAPPTSPPHGKRSLVNNVCGDVERSLESVRGARGRRGADTTPPCSICVPASSAVGRNGRFPSQAKSMLVSISGHIWPESGVCCSIPGQFPPITDNLVDTTPMLF